MEVLDQGGRAPSRWRRWAAAAALLGAVVLAALGVRALLEPAVAPGPRIAAIAVVEARAVNPNAEGSGWAGAPGIPGEAVLPGAVVDLAIEPDPDRPLVVMPAESSGALHIEPGLSVDVARGTAASARLVLAPADCEAPRTPTGLDEAGYRWREAAGVRLLVDENGTPLPLSDAARDGLARLLADLCAPAGQPPRLTTVDARLDGPPREQRLEITARLEARDGSAPAPQSVTVNPIDGPGLRAIGSFTRQTSEDLTLMWSVAPLGEFTGGELVPSVQVVTVIEGTAYPWVLRIEPRSPLQRPGARGGTEP